MENKGLDTTWIAKVFLILSLESLIFINTNTTTSIIPLSGIQESGTQSRKDCLVRLEMWETGQRQKTYLRRKSEEKNTTSTTRTFMKGEI